MTYNFLRDDRDQPFPAPARPTRLAARRPPRLFVLDVVDQLLKLWRHTRSHPASAATAA
jgi:hypothetical protein